MNYISTRHGSPRSKGSPAPLGFEDVMLAGLARDGGLYLPAEWPQFSTAEIAALKGKPYREVAYRVMQPFVGDAFDEMTFRRLIAEAYASFDVADVAPLKPLDDEPAPARAVPRPDARLQGRGAAAARPAARPRAAASGTPHATIVGATSGDTGSAAIEACRDRAPIDIFMLHPRGRVSEVQRRQMTTVLAPNVHNIAVEGTFDDCQDLVKALFADLAFRDRHALTAVNSINWARVMAQIVYYFCGGADARRAGRGRSPSPCRPAISATSMPATPRSRWACRSRTSSSATNTQRHPRPLLRDRRR